MASYGDGVYGEGIYGGVTGGSAEGSIAVELPVPAALFTGTHTPPNLAGAVDVEIPMPDVEFAGTYLAASTAGALDVDIPVLDVTISGTYEAPTVDGWNTVDLDTVIIGSGGSYAGGQIVADGYPEYWWPGLVLDPTRQYEIEVTYLDDTETYFDIYAMAGDTLADYENSNYYWLGFGEDPNFGENPETVNKGYGVIGPGLNQWDTAVAAGEHYLFISGYDNTTITAVRWRELEPAPTYTGTLNVDLPALEIQFTGTTAWAGTDPSADDDDWDVVGHVEYDPPVVPQLPEFAEGAEVYAQAFGTITMVGTEAVHSIPPVQVFAPAYGLRVIVDGQDVTFFRGAPLPRPSYQRVEPFDYNTATLKVPQVLAWAEEHGVGDRSWMRHDAPVEFQVYDYTNDVKIATVFKGWVKSVDTDGDLYTLQLDGEVLGRATDDFRPQELFRSKADIGLLMMRAIRRLGGRTADRYGPTTKIVQYRVGRSKMVHYLLETMGIAQDKRGRQWTIMPDEQGRYAMYRKNTTDIDFTIYATGSSGAYPAQLRDDLGTRINQAYATGLTPEGMRILFGRYPGFQQMDPPPFPGPLSEGDSGEQVTVLIRRLANFNYLTLDELPGGYDDDVVEAVERLQRQAQLNVTGVVNAATWRALFDLDTTGRTLRNSKVAPAAALSYTEQYMFSATGAIIGFNPDWDPTRRRVAEFYDFGAGYRRNVLEDFAQAELDDGSPNWAGTITVKSGAVIAGQHNPGDPLTEADIMHASLIKPGMNAWVVRGNQGARMRVAIVDVQENGDVQLRVDCRNRDAMKLAQVIARIRASKDNAGRSWWKDYKSGGQKEALAEYSEVGGYLDEGVDLERGWNVIPLIAGESGTIRSIEFDTFPPTETVVAVTGEAVVEDVFERNIGDPSTEAGTARWSDPDVIRRLKQNHGLIYQAGGYNEMGGYYPGSQSGTSSILTGEFADEAGVPYYTRRLPVLYLVIWAGGRTRLRSGRIMYPNMEPV